MTSALLLSLALVFSAGGVASAAPTAEFTFGPTAPTVRQPVTFTFLGNCDIPPCIVEWRYFTNGGSSLGTSMGRGETLEYAFPRADLYTVRVRITNGLGTNGSATATHSLVVTGTVQDHDRRIGYDAWSGSNHPQATGAGFRTTTSATSEVSHVFTGPEVAYLARTGPDKGIAALLIGGTQRLVDLYAPTHGTTSFPVTGLSDGRHRVRVRPTGTRNDASTGTAVAVDGFVAGTTQVDDTSSTVDYNTWVAGANPKANGGTVRNSSTTGAGTAFVFWGPSVTWVSTTGPGQGQANVTIDGSSMGIVDGYSPTQTWQVEHTYTDLGTGRHVIRVMVAGSRNASSTGNRVASDAFIVR